VQQELLLVEMEVLVVILHSAQLLQTVVAAVETLLRMALLAVLVVAVEIMVQQ
jgi:hypothetical protein